ncbi:alpha/beta hydrolase fold domain-containing protein [Rhodococcus sp. JVH1]|uniref:flavin-containing monooxygenase n=1 Tax=Rhodococcus sp. JVH1 TaxID=745408 RepID=UPI000271F947|nr:alpha/beta hydrolase fold domain-containing protein [Rhodococcus sp. JVH1]EJI97768.1 steroid monooxygenase [Rhodococcus sp. JVH1]
MTHNHVDAVIVGAGFSGLYATHRLRNQQGLSVQSFEAMSGPGGVWNRNRYPGARCDFESIFYSFSFDEDLQKEWRWTERFAAQPEILAYLEHVADRFDLRRSYRFNTRVTSAVWREDAERWEVRTDDGAVTMARYFINGAGAFSVSKPNDFPGQDDFEGTIAHTTQWPDDIDLAGKRVAVIGTGSTGIQVIQTIAGEVGELTVFQRTPNYACPLGNRPMADEEFADVVADYPRLRAESRASLAGAPYPRPERPALMDTPEQREQVYDQHYDGGGFRMLASTYFDLIYDADANETAAEYIRGRIRQRVNDPKIAELLCPTNHPYGVKRATFETGYFEVFNLPHVHLVDARTAPIERITRKGIATTDHEYEFDVIVLATGFDVGAGALVQMGVVGRDGRKLADHWSDGQRAYLGMATHGFPNLFHINGPQSAAALFNNPIAIEDSVDFVGGLIAHTDAADCTRVEVSESAENRYNELVREVADATLFPTATTWYMGDNIKGKARTPLSLFTGAPMYRAICAEVEATGYAGFTFDQDEQPLSSLVQVDGSAVFFLAGMMNIGAKPLAECNLEEARAAMDMFQFFQASLPSDVTISEVDFPSGNDGRKLRLYRPTAVQGPLPVVLFLHGGGWIGGSLDAFNEPCAALAHNTGALVVSPEYRLAPEHPFPAAVEDTLSALRWVAENIAVHGGDPERIAVGGESAGANLAAVAAQRARDEDGPRLTAQVLVAPVTDPFAETESRKLFANGPVLSMELCARMAGMYAVDPTDLASPSIAPARAADLSGLPPTLVLTMGVDPLRDEGEDYARALAAAGTPAESRRFEGLIHTTLSMSGSLPRAAEVQAALAAFLAPLLCADPATTTAGV